MRDRQTDRQTDPIPMPAESRLLVLMAIGGVRVMTGVKQGDSGQRSKPVRLIN